MLHFLYFPRCLFASQQAYWPTRRWNFDPCCPKSTNFNYEGSISCILRICIYHLELTTWRLRKHYKADVLRGHKWSFSDYKPRCGGCNLLWGWSHHLLCNTSFNTTPAMNSQTIWEILIKHCMSIVGFKGKVEVRSDSWQWICCLPSESYLDRGCASWRQSHRALWDKLCSEKLSLDSNDQETGGRL